MTTLVIVACALFATPPAQEKEFHGTVVDSNGKPAVDVPVDTYWNVIDGKLAPRAGTRTDSEGRFRVRINCQAGRPSPLMAVDKAVTRGAVVVLDADQPAVEVTLKLAPMVPARGEITSKNLGAPITGCFVSITPAKAILALVGFNCPGPFSLQIPPGDYRVSYHAADCIAANNKAVSVAADAKEFDLGTIDLAPTVLSQLYGKPPPEWTVSDARGVSKSVKLEDFKGKWVLLEFWGFW